MKTEIRTPNLPNRTAFSLIELLVVIAVISILAGLVFAAMPAIHGARVRAVARAEITQLATAIEAFKGKYGSYPQDNRLNLTNNPLYFELSGMLITGANYRSLDGSYTVATNLVLPLCNVSGIVNSSRDIAGSDDQPPIVPYLREIKPTQLRTNNQVRFLICSADDSSFCYNSSNPTNNPGSFDLWVDLVVGGKTNRIGNWTRN